MRGLEHMRDRLNLTNAARSFGQPSGVVVLRCRLGAILIALQLGFSSSFDEASNGLLEHFSSIR